MQEDDRLGDEVVYHKANNILILVSKKNTFNHVCINEGGCDLFFKRLLRFMQKMVFIKIQIVVFVFLNVLVCIPVYVK